MFKSGAAAFKAAARPERDCLGLLLAVFLLPILAFSVLKVRGFLNRSGKEKPDFTSLRSTGKTIVNASPPDDDDPDQFGSVN